MWIAHAPFPVSAEIVALRGLGDSESRSRMDASCSIMLQRRSVDRVRSMEDSFLGLEKCWRKPILWEREWEKQGGSVSADTAQSIPDNEVMKRSTNVVLHPTCSPR